MTAQELDFRRVRTARLELSEPAAGDLAELHALLGDPRVWQHFPSGRHADFEQTDAIVSHLGERWQEHGLGPWIARAIGDDGTASELVGFGGCHVWREAFWNLGYRFGPEVWGRGLAQELISAGLAAAHQVGPDRPVIARLLEHNARSRAAAERAGLELVFEGPDVGNPDPSAVRLVFADRELPADVLRLVAF